MLEIVLCDNNIPELQQLTFLITKYCQDRPDIPVRVRRFQSLFDLIDAVTLDSAFHICLLDHRGGQPWMNGLSPEALLRQAAPELSIIGFTGDPHSAFLSPSPGDPLGLEAHLVKPVSTTDLYAVLDRLVGQWLPKIPIPALAVSTSQGWRALPFRQLVRVHCRGHLNSCHMADGEVVEVLQQRAPFNHFTLPLLRERNFFPLSSSCVVNLDFVAGLDKKASTVRLSDGTVLQVPKSAFPGLLKDFREYTGS